MEELLQKHAQQGPAMLQDNPPFGSKVNMSWD